LSLKTWIDFPPECAHGPDFAISPGRRRVMPGDHDYAHRKNIINFKRQIEAARDNKQLTVLRTLLAEELAKDKPPRVG
jgi:hypothetical protein